MISYKDHHSTDVLFHQRCYNKFTPDHKSVESNRKDKDSVEKATAEKRYVWKKIFDATKNTSDKPKILLSYMRFADWN